jgi:hypothetical protein
MVLIETFQTRVEYDSPLFFPSNFAALLRAAASSPSVSAVVTKTASTFANIDRLQKVDLYLHYLAHCRTLALTRLQQSEGKESIFASYEWSAYMEDIKPKLVLESLLAFLYSCAAHENISNALAQQLVRDTFQTVIEA